MSTFNKPYAINKELVIAPALEAWGSTFRMFSEEASTLGFTKPYALYNDACDLGIWVKSPWTGNVEPFILSHVVRDVEDDIQCWQFVNREKNVTFLIYND